MQRKNNIKKHIVPRGDQTGVLSPILLTSSPVIKDYHSYSSIALMLARHYDNCLHSAVSSAGNN